MSQAEPAKSWYDYRRQLAESRDRLDAVLEQLALYLRARFQGYPDDPLTGKPPVFIDDDGGQITLRSVSGAELIFRKKLQRGSIKLSKDTNVPPPSNTRISEVFGIDAGIGGMEPQIVIDLIPKAGAPPERRSVPLSSFYAAVERAILTTTEAPY